MIDLLGHILVIAIFWFIIYWVLGGVFFAAVAIMQVIKLRRARFSCLFTLASAVCAVGASYSGARTAEGAIRACMEDATDVFGRLASIVACGIFEQMASGVIWFFVLLLTGFLLFIISRAKNQSWIDSDEGLEDDRYDVIEL